MKRVDPTPLTDAERYARCVEVSKRVRWEIERDLIRGRTFDFGKKFLPDGLSLVHELGFLDAGEQRLLSQVQGRTYANLFAMVERFINAKVLELSRRHWLGDQTALEALVRFSDEELKHQAMFRQVEAMIGEGMPAGYRFAPDVNAVARLVLSKSSWAVLAVTCHIELFTQTHYRQSIAPDPSLSELFRDLFLFHWREESQHAIIDELEWVHEHERLDVAGRDRGVNDFIELLADLDGVLRLQARADAEWFGAICGRSLTGEEGRGVEALLLRAYRWQYITSGLAEARFRTLLRRLVTAAQAERLEAAFQSLQD
jgi:hypothetical protein